MLSKNPKLFAWFERWPTWLMYSTVAVISGGYFAWLQFSGGFADPDSFYHARFAAQLNEIGLPVTFPWLRFTTLADQFTDLHLFYHLLLWPVTSWLEPTLAAKALQVILLIALTMTLLAVLRRWRVPYAPLAIALLYTVWPFVVRINLVKATALAMIILFCIISALFAKRYWWVLGLTALYTWAHAGFVLALALAVIVWLAMTMAQSGKSNRLYVADPRGILTGLAGTMIGIGLNPYFPSNLAVYWQQVVQIGLVNYQGTVGVGAEWYAYPFGDLIGSTSLLMIAVVGGMVLMIKQRKKYLTDPVALFLWMAAVVFFAATLRSRRFVEYFVPFIGLWAMYVVLPYIASGQWRTDWRTFRRGVGKAAVVLAVYLSVVIPLGMARAVWLSYKDLLGDFPLTTYQAASRFIASRAMPNDLVFHANWDEFPMLYYQNPQQHYIVGLDATFMYLRDPALYQRWRAISAGKLKMESAQAIRNEFSARYVFIDRREKKSQLLNAYLRRDENVRLIFEDEDTRVYYIL